MNPNTNKMTWHIDRMVVLVFVSLIAVSSIIVGFKLYYHEPCPNVTFEVQKYNLRADEVIHFTNLTNGAYRYEWDFGDSTELVYAEHPMHIYSKPGEYMVKLKVNGQCFDYKTIVVKNSIPVVDETLIPSFAAPAKVKVGEKVRFNALTDGATSWEWRFGETGKVDSRTKNPTYSFKQPGRVKVSLIVNGNMKYIAEKTVKVLPKSKRRARKRPTPKPKEEPYIPESPEEYVEYEEVVEPGEPAFEYISDEDLLILIKDVAEGRQKKELIDPYLCSGMYASVFRVNGEMMRVMDFFEKIEGKELKIKKLFSFRDQNQCIVRVEIKYRTKLF